MASGEPVAGRRQAVTVRTPDVHLDPEPVEDRPIPPRRVLGFGQRRCSNQAVEVAMVKSMALPVAKNTTTVR
jgi:hypothetical protein